MDLTILNDKINNSKYFAWKEALYLRNWNLHAFPSEEVKSNIITVCEKMDAIRDLVGRPITITSWYRPAAYNLVIGGAKLSSHMFGKACDFTVMGMDPDDVRMLLIPHLKPLNIRMEDLPGSSWVHIDIACDSKTEKRFFKP